MPGAQRRETTFESPDNLTTTHTKLMQILPKKQYQIIEDAQTRIIAKHILTTTVDPHNLEVQLIPVDNTVRVVLRIDYWRWRWSEKYLKKLAPELSNFIASTKTQDSTTQVTSQQNQVTKTSKTLTDQEIMDYLNIVPPAFQKELARATKDGDANRRQLFLKTKIRPFVENYVASIMNPEFPHGNEQVLWRHTITKGLFNKQILGSWVITDIRAVKATPKEIAFKRQDMPTVKMHSDIVGLAVCDTVVMNQQRISKGNRIGNFVGSGRGGFVGTGISSSSSFSSTYGDLVFFFNGKEVFRFPGISDPNGVRKMVETVKKQKLTDLQAVGTLASSDFPDTQPSSVNIVENDTMERLRNLRDMMEQNLITKEDYEKKKNEILSQV